MSELVGADLAVIDLRPTHWRTVMRPSPFHHSAGTVPVIAVLSQLLTIGFPSTRSTGNVTFIITLTLTYFCCIIKSEYQLMFLYRYGSKYFLD